MDVIYDSEFKDRHVTLSTPWCLPLTANRHFFQIYFMDGTAADQVERRSRITDGLRLEMLLDLQETSQTNQFLYVRDLRYAYMSLQTQALLTSEPPSVKAEDQQEHTKERW